MIDDVSLNTKVLDKYKKENIVLYGLSERTNKLINKYSDYNIVGLMDGIQVDGEIFGKKIISYDDCINLKVKLIIIVARESSCQIIFKRIFRFCNKNNILLFDCLGNNLFSKYESLVKSDMNYYNLNEDLLKNEINKHDVISFDIFDTLLMRKILMPDDLFVIMEERLKELNIFTGDFLKLRKESDFEIGYTNPNIYDIYNNFKKKTGISEEIKNTILNMEIEYEKKVLVKRDKMVEILNYAKSIGKKVFLISDMYLPKEIIEDFLKSLGIIGYDNLFISCDVKKSKYTGIYSWFKEKNYGKTYLHIGDNEEADGKCAEKEGIDSFLIKSANSMLSISSAFGIERMCKTINDRTIIGLIIAKLFNNPFSLYKSKGKIVLNNYKECDYLFVAPVVTRLVLWLVEKVQQGNYKNILFASRDGYIIEQLYKYFLDKFNLDKLPRGIYFETSRVACATASVTNEEDIKWILGPKSDKKPEELLKERFLIDENKVSKWDEEKYGSVLEYALDNKEAIYNNSKELKKSYLKYCDKLGINEGKYAFFDLVSCGTCQRLLQRFINVDLDGLYLCRYYNKKDEEDIVKISSLYENHVHYYYYGYGYECNIYKHYFLLEKILTSFKPSMLCIGKEIKPVYGKEVRKEDEMEFIEEAHLAIKEFFYDFIDNLYVYKIPISNALIDTIFGLIDEEYTEDNCNYFSKIKIVNDFGLEEISVGRKDTCKIKDEK